MTPEHRHGGQTNMAKEPQTRIRGATRGGREGMQFWGEFVQKLDKILYFVSPYDGPRKTLQAIEATRGPCEFCEGHSGIHGREVRSRRRIDWDGSLYSLQSIVL